MGSCLRALRFGKLPIVVTTLRAKGCSRTSRMVSALRWARHRRRFRYDGERGEIVVAVLKIITVADGKRADLLRRRCHRVNHINPSTNKFVDDMIETVKTLPALGLAANQVGVQKRIIVLFYEEKTHVLINPEVVRTSGELEEGIEQCLSIPDVAVVVPRFTEIMVRRYGRGGQFRAEGILARALQHELDHLDGILITDRGEPFRPPSLTNRDHSLA